MPRSAFRPALAYRSRTARLDDPRAPCSLTDSAYQRLRGAIIECQLAPRQRLTEGSMAERFRVGKMPAREALQRLVSEGLVQVIPRHGYAVAPITLRDVRELFELRLVVEPAAVERAVANFDASHYATLKKLGAVGYTVGGRESVRRYLRANTELHSRIGRLSGNRRIAELVAKIMLESERLINFILPAHPESKQTVSEHKRLLEAMANGEVALARRVAEQHIHSTRQMVVERLLSDSRFEESPIEVNESSSAPNPQRRSLVPSSLPGPRIHRRSV